MTMKWPRARVHSAIIFPALLLTMGMPADVLAQNLSGDWDVRWAQAVRVNRDGTVEIQSWGSADLSLVQDGTRLTGTWTTHVGETVTWMFTGTAHDGRFSLKSTGHDSDNPELAVVVGVRWEGAWADGHIEGHVAMRFEGMRREPARRPFSAEPIERASDRERPSEADDHAH
ncbi:MAG: hypothetical protein IIC35_09100 [Gemmatimonadetes bacterium]|nr:hypothetical protein [Gemmatimonadota bacterium]